MQDSERERRQPVHELVGGQQSPVRGGRQRHDGQIHELSRQQILDGRAGHKEHNGGERRLIRTEAPRDAEEGNRQQRQVEPVDPQRRVGRVGGVVGPGKKKMVGRRKRRHARLGRQVPGVRRASGFERLTVIEGDLHVDRLVPRGRTGVGPVVGPQQDRFRREEEHEPQQAQNERLAVGRLGRRDVKVRGHGSAPIIIN